MRSLVLAAILVAGCGKQKQPAGEPLILDDATCTGADSCAADCERGVMAACALASTAYNLGYQVTADPDLGASYRQRYLALRARACKQGHAASCNPAAPSAEKPDWEALRTQCAAGHLNACLRCRAALRGDDCSRTPP